MKKSVKAALWSGLVFPGAGHFFLKRTLRGMLLFIPALLSTILLVRGLLAQAELVMDKVASGAAPPDAQVIGALLDAAPETPIMNIAFWILAVCWVLGVIDAYRLGSIRDKIGK
ncbi:MAG: hypothetical protein ACHP7O_04305 [Burkholderiales bacterium]